MAYPSPNSFDLVVHSCPLCSFGNTSAVEGLLISGLAVGRSWSVVLCLLSSSDPPSLLTTEVNYLFPSVCSVVVFGPCFSLLFLYTILGRVIYVF